MGMNCFIVWNPRKEEYLTHDFEWSRFVTDSALFPDHGSAMWKIRDLGIDGLRVKEKWVCFDPVSHRVHVGGYEWLTKTPDFDKIKRLGGVVFGTKHLVIRFPEFEIRYFAGENFFSVEGAPEEVFKKIIEEKLNNHE